MHPLIVFFPHTYYMRNPRNQPISSPNPIASPNWPEPANGVHTPEVGVITPGSIKNAPKKLLIIVILHKKNEVT